MNSLVNPQSQSSSAYSSANVSPQQSRQQSPMPIIKTHPSLKRPMYQVLKYGLKGLKYVYKAGMGYMVYRIWQDLERMKQQEIERNKYNTQNNYNTRNTKTSFEMSKSNL